jgi:hopanoid biosynthesis associated protein HpnK
VQLESAALKGTGSAPAPARQRFLIVTADDFGLHESVNEAIEQASRSGVLTAASLMVAAPAAADAVRRARALPDLKVGLHVVLADGAAMLPREAIADLVGPDGRFGNRMFIDGVRYFAMPRVRRQLEAEIRAQFEAFASTGLELDHVNAHKHFHLHPTLLAIILRVGKDFGMRAMRVPREPVWFSGAGAMLPAAAAGALLSPWLAIMSRQLKRAGIAHNDQLFGIAATGAMNEERLLEILSRLPPGVTEIYLHPATQSGATINPAQDGYRHASELAALVSPRVRAAILEAKVPCGGYADISRARELWHASSRISARKSP